MKILNLLLIILIAFGCNKKSKYECALEESLNGNFEEALRLVDEHLIDNAATAEIYFFAGSCAARVYDDAKAVEFWHKAEQLDANLAAKVAVNESSIYQRAGENELAYEKLLRAVKIISDDDLSMKSLLFSDAANLAMFLGRSNEAMQNFEKALTYDAKNVDALLGKASLALVAGDFYNPEVAEKLAKEAATLRPNLVTYSTLGEAYFQNKKVKLAIETVKITIETYGHLATPKFLTTLQERLQAYERAWYKGN